MHEDRCRAVYDNVMSSYEKLFGCDRDGEAREVDDDVTVLFGNAK